MILESLKVFHIWARSMLYVSPKEAFLPPILAELTMPRALKCLDSREKLYSISPLAKAW
jgi:hypothetical protein